MRVQRLDVGADVVHIPTRDLLVIHPDLEYGEALGAVRATCPDMHMDAVVAAVEQVTPRPKPDPKPDRPAYGVRLVSTLVALLLSVAIGATSLTPASATMFGDTWASQMQRLGLACEHSGEAKVVTCTEKDGDLTRVAAYRREDATLYVIRRRGPDHCLLIFDTKEAARRWSASRIDAVVTGRVAVLS